MATCGELRRTQAGKPALHGVAGCHCTLSGCLRSQRPDSRDQRIAWALTTGSIARGTMLDGVCAHDHREERQSNELSCQFSECGQAAAVDKWIQTIAWFMEVTLDTPPYRPQAGRPAFHTSAALWQSRRIVGHWILFPSTKLVCKWG